MKFRVEVVCISDAGHEHRSDILEMERHELAMETLGLNLCESKMMLENVQKFVVARQPPRIWSSGTTARIAEIGIPSRAAGRSE